MKIKVDLDKGETLEQADEQLEKALKAKKECVHGEQYDDDIYNALHEEICQHHSSKVLDVIKKELREVIKNACISKYY
jgi:hypothetical protein